jgi:hypothetical protein
MNGDRPETLKAQLCATYTALCETQKAMRNAAPNARNYYPQEGLFEKAIAKHARMWSIIDDLRSEILEELHAIEAQESRR